MAFIVKREIISAPATLPLSTAQVRLNTTILVNIEGNVLDVGNITLDNHPSSTFWYAGWGGGCLETHLIYETDRWNLWYHDYCNYNDYILAEKIASGATLPIDGYTMMIPVFFGSVNLIAV